MVVTVVMEAMAGVLSVAELLAGAAGVLDPALAFELLRQAELRGVSCARMFLLQLASWNLCDTAVVWKLRKLFNQTTTHEPLWVPLAA